VILWGFFGTKLAFGHLLNCPVSWMRKWFGCMKRFLKILLKKCMADFGGPRCTVA
jgi:hypothetical protein